MAAPKRTPFERERDLEITAGMYLRGMTQAAIGKRIGVSQRQISSDLKLLQKRWQQSALVDIDAVKGKELAKIDALERTYWQAWRKSQKESQRTSTSKKGMGEDGEIVARVDKESQVGDPRYLQGVQWCIERRCKIVGIDAPARQQITGAGGGPVEIKQADREQATRELTEWQREQLKRLNEQSAGMQTPTA